MIQFGIELLNSIANLVLFAFPGLLGFYFFCGSRQSVQFIEASLCSTFTFFLLAWVAFSFGMPITRPGFMMLHGINLILFLSFARKFRVKIDFPTLKGISIDEIKSFLARNGVEVFSYFLVFLFYLFDTYKFTQIRGDSNFYWYAKGLTLSHERTFEVYRYLYGPTRPSLLPIVYAYFVTFKLTFLISTWHTFFAAFSAIYGIAARRKVYGSKGVAWRIAFFGTILFACGRNYSSYADLPLAIGLMIFSTKMWLLNQSNKILKYFDYFCLFSFFVMLSQIKENGSYISLIILILTLYLFLTAERPRRDLLKGIFVCELFGMVGCVALKIQQNFWGAESFVQGAAVATLHEIFASPNPFFAYWLRLKTVLNFAPKTLVSSPEVWVVLALIPFWAFLKNKALNALVVLIACCSFFGIFVVYPLVPFESIDWFLQTGFSRMMFHMSAMSLLLLFLAKPTEKL